MAKQISLQPIDVAIALRLAESLGAAYESLHEDLGISISDAHYAVERLTIAGILHPHQRKVNRHALLEFLQFGVRYAFPARLQGLSRGVPTSHSAPPLAESIIADDDLVWPDPKGSIIGDSIAPLYRKATELPGRCPSLYELLTLVDAVRIGRARERNLAVKELRRRIGYQRADSHE